MINQRYAPRSYDWDTHYDGTQYSIRGFILSFSYLDRGFVKRGPDNILCLSCLMRDCQKWEINPTLGLINEGNRCWNTVFNSIQFSSILASCALFGFPTNVFLSMILSCIVMVKNKLKLNWTEWRLAWKRTHTHIHFMHMRRIEQFYLTRAN